MQLCSANMSCMLLSDIGIDKQRSQTLSTCRVKQYSTIYMYFMCPEIIETVFLTLYKAVRIYFYFFEK